MAVDYIKPDIISGTESWLKGYKPVKIQTSDEMKVSKGAKIKNRYNQVPHLTHDTNGKVTKTQLKTSEIFPDNYNVFRIDKGILGVGVFIAAQNNISAVECVDVITGC